MACLIVERHEWETGSDQAQMQIPLGPAAQFFGQGRQNVKVRLVDTGQVIDCSVSKTYTNGTRRINGLPILGTLGHCFVFFQRTASARYDVWWDTDVAIIGARFNNWSQARDSQYGRGRLVAIANGQVPRYITRVDS